MVKDSNNYWEQLERLEKLIRASEIKAGIIFSFHSLIIGIIVDNLNYLSLFFKENTLFIVLVSLWIISVLISIYFCFKCFKPHMELKYNRNVFFFGDTANQFKSIEEYSKNLIQVCESEDELAVQLSEQIHVESIIIDKKFKSIKNSLNYFALSLIFIFFMLLFIFFKIN